MKILLRGGWEQAYDLQASGDFRQWQDWKRLTNQGNSSELILTNNVSTESRFYRAQQELE